MNYKVGTMSHSPVQINTNTASSCTEVFSNLYDKFLLINQREKTKIALADQDGNLASTDSKRHAELSSLLDEISNKLSSVSITMTNIVTLMGQMLDKSGLSSSDINALSGARAALVPLSKMPCSLTVKILIDEIISYHDSKKCASSETQQTFADLKSKIKYIERAISQPSS